MKKLITLTALLFLAVIFSCNKSEVSAPGSAELKLGPKKYINAIVLTDAPYYQHEDNYGEGHMLEFGIHFRTDENVALITESLAFIKNALETGDTTGAYLYPYTYLIPNAGYLDCWPDHELQDSPKFGKFKTWYEEIVYNWMVENNCTRIAVGKNKPQYWVKAHCTVEL